ncbi:hypothetical protein F2Q70_00024768 [Brassica cretica]|uniref:Uncharacterized protein n=1 Tax=Brassica cretica TaxID=69181 RepID=A0A8S9LD11_BRACR|nr:hypothetical protein F2Q70_00024768 [Brassica cretica]
MLQVWMSPVKEEEQTVPPTTGRGKNPAVNRAGTTPKQKYTERSKGGLGFTLADVETLVPVEPRPHGTFNTSRS